MTNQAMKRRTPILDARLSAAMELAENCRIFADIGADHGRLSAVLLQNPERFALIADISAPALDKAKSLIARSGLSSRAVFAVADGLDALDQLKGKQADTIFILGMGGDTVSGILQRGVNRLQGAALILGAQTDLPLVRRTLASIGYRIDRERVACEANRDYILIRAVPGFMQLTEEEALLGPVFLRELPENWLSVLRRREQLLLNGLNAMRVSKLDKDAERLALFEREIIYVQRAMSNCERKWKL